MTSRDNYPCNKSNNLEPNIFKRRSPSWKYDDLPRKENKQLKLKLTVEPSKVPQNMDLKPTRRIGLSSKVNKTTAPANATRPAKSMGHTNVMIPAKPTVPAKTTTRAKAMGLAVATSQTAPLKTLSNKKDQISKQLTIKNNLPTVFEEKSSRINGKSIPNTTLSEQEAQSSQEITKELIFTQKASQKIGVVKHDEFNDIKCVIKKSIDEHQVCVRKMKETVQKHQECLKEVKESSERLGLLIGIIKRRLPSVLDSLPSDTAQSLEELEDACGDHAVEEDSIYKKDEDLVQKLLFILKEFNSYALVLEKHPEIRTEAFLSELQIREELFEENMIKFKQKTSWLLSTGIQALETPAQKLVKLKYKNYLELLDTYLKSMKVKRKHLAQTLNSDDSGNEDVADSEELKMKGNSSDFIIPSGSESPLTKDEVEIEMEEGKDEENINVGDKEETESREVTIDQNSPDKSMPALEDLLSDNESREETHSPTPSTADLNDVEMIQTVQPHLEIHQDETNNDQYIVETIITEVGSELDENKNNDSSQDVGNHFLTSQIATVCSPTGQGFLYNVALKPSPENQKPFNKMTTPSPETTNQCSECNEFFQKKESLYSHKFLNHVTRLCNLCNSIFGNMMALKAHVASNHPQCRLCLECGIAMEADSFTAHADTHLKTNLVDGKLKCRACLKTFSSPEKVKKHEKEHKNAFHLCKHCGDLFLTRFELQEHSTMHLAEGIDICKVCYLDFSDKPSLQRHLKMNHQTSLNRSPEMYECMLCHNLSSDEMELIHHIRCTHENDDLCLRASCGVQDGTPRNKCSYCNSFFKMPRVRAIHEIIFHEMPPYKCSCNTAFFNKAILDVHVLKHSRIEEENLKKPRRSKKVVNVELGL